MQHVLSFRPYTSTFRSREFMQSICFLFLLLPAMASATPVLEPLALDPLDPRAQGVWLAAAYGQLIVADEDSLRLFNVTQSFCAQDESVGDLTALDLFVAFEDDRLLFSFRPEGSTVYVYERIAEIPSSCSVSVEPTAANAFDFFAENMAQYYAFFDLYGVEWDERVRAGRARIKSGMSERELFATLEESLEGLGDAHLGLHAEIDGEDMLYGGKRSSLGHKLDAVQAAEGVEDRSKFQARWRKRNAKNLRKLLGKSQTVRADGQLIWGRIGAEGGVGYIQVRGMGGFAETEGYDVEIAAVHRLIGEAVRALAGSKAMIVDVSMNGGGMDEVSLAIAGHFTEKRQFAYTKRAFGAAGIDPQPLYVEPAPSDRYIGPVTLLTSNVSVSAAEIFTLAMRALPNVTHRGESTRGAFSDVLEKFLPNGWLLRMSNEIYEDPEGTLWEGRGVEPEDKFDVFRQGSLWTSHTDVLSELAARLVETEN